MEKINVKELLRNCPKGMELDCIIFNGKVYFEGIDDNNSAYPIKISVNLVDIEHLDIYGQYNTRDYSKCVIFPKGKTTWEGFQIPFKNGDIVAFDSKCGTQIFLFKEYIYDHNYAQCYMMLNCSGDIDFESRCYFVERFATEEEKEKLFKAIKEHGYRWNPETKTLEKLIQPKFKVGDRIVHKENRKTPFVITKITKQSYKGGTQFEVLIEQQDNFELVPTIVPKFNVWYKIKRIKTGNIYEIIKIVPNYYIAKYLGSEIIISWADQDEYELVPDKFDISILKPFESKVLIRDTKSQKWSPAIWGFYDSDHKDYQYKLVGVIARYCIPYEGNEHLLGKTDECNEYFKNWK